MTASVIPESSQSNIANGMREVKLDDVLSVVTLAEAHRNECAAHLQFLPSAIARSYGQLAADIDRRYLNAWIYYKEGKPIGYAVASSGQFFFNDDWQSRLEILYVLPEHRGSYAAIKLVKAYEEWSRLNGCLQLYVGVARLDVDEAKHIRKLFPKLGYDWCGSYYVKETVR